MIYEQTRFVDLATRRGLQEASLYQLSNTNILYRRFWLMWFDPKMCGHRNFAIFRIVGRRTRCLDLFATPIVLRVEHDQYCCIDMDSPLVSNICVQSWVVTIGIDLLKLTNITCHSEKNIKGTFYSTSNIQCMYLMTA